MASRRRSIAVWSLAVLFGWLCGSAGATPASFTDGQRRAQPGGGPGAAIVLPDRQIGDSWIVETKTLRLQGAHRGKGEQPRTTLRWRFEVKGEEQIEGEPCWRIEVNCITPNTRSGPITLWTSKRTGALRRLRAAVLSAAGVRYIDETYGADGGRAAPALTPIKVLPCDTPVLADIGTKDFQNTYRCVVRPTGGETKAVELSGFTYRITQTASEPPEQTKDMVEKSVSDQFSAEELIMIKLRGPHSEVKQYWGPGLPWPAIVENDTTVARLVAVHRAPRRKPAPDPTRQNESNRRAPNPNEAGPSAQPQRNQEQDTDKALPGDEFKSVYTVLDEGICSYSPWSGYWWPMQSGDLIIPLSKYDQVTGKNAAGWEQVYHYDPSGPEWQGHCHNWAAAAVMEHEPQEYRQVRGVTFGIGDQKGLLTAAHGNDVADSWGDRFGDGEGTEDPADLAPDQLWRLLQTFVRDMKVPLIVDADPGEQVWNFPVFYYQVVGYPIGGNTYQCVLTMQISSCHVDPDFLGVAPETYACEFVVDIDGGQIVMGTGRWVGESAGYHPDFAWYPRVAQPENPEVELKLVADIVGYKVGGQQPPALPERPSASRPESRPQPTGTGSTESRPTDIAEPATQPGSNQPRPTTQPTVTTQPSPTAQPATQPGPSQPTSDTNQPVSPGATEPAGTETTVPATIPGPAPRPESSQQTPPAVGAAPTPQVPQQQPGEVSQQRRDQTGEGTLRQEQQSTATPTPAQAAQRPAAVSAEQLLMFALNNKIKQAWYLDVIVDRYDGGTYRLGEPVKIFLRSGQRGYLYLFHQGPGDRMPKLIYARASKKGGKYHFPITVPADVNIELTGRGKALFCPRQVGKHRIFALVTAQRLPVGWSPQQAANLQFHKQGTQRVDKPTQAKPEQQAAATVGPFAIDECYFVVQPAGKVKNRPAQADQR